LSNVTVIVPPSLRKFVGGKTHDCVQAATVRGALEAFAAGSSNMRDYLFDHNDMLRRFVRVFVDGKPATVQPGQEEPVPEGAKMTILLALAGG
jgi:hypothetical protein